MATNQKDTLADQVQKEARSHAIRWLIGAVVSLIAISVFGWWTFLRPIIERAVGVPSGAIMAFDLGSSRECPEGWEILRETAGRVVVGAGDPQANKERAYGFDDTGRPLTPRKYRQHGGEEIVQLSIDQMPSHGHNYETRARVMKQSGTHTAVWEGSAQAESSLAGGDKPHNNMPPYIAFYYCKKI
ncbi:MAG: hypothetical protein ACK5IP_20605 [Paracoccus sp. (in: a-proteobacteria)]